MEPIKSSRVWLSEDTRWDDYVAWTVWEYKDGDRDIELTFQLRGRTTEIWIGLAGEDAAPMFTTLERLATYLSSLRALAEMESDPDADIHAKMDCLGEAIIAAEMEGGEQ